MGVANRTLRCGTLVNVSYRGRRLIVPVIDRGPYANGADWDLTTEAARVLGIELPSGDRLVVEPDHEWTVTAEGLISKGKNTPLLGRTLQGRVRDVAIGRARMEKKGAGLGAEAIAGR